MYFTLGDILVTGLLGAAGLYFLSAIRVRERAVQAITREGRDDDYQILDQDGHIRRISMSRDRQGRWRVWRQSLFDYSFDGVELCQGHVIMLGKQLEAIVVSDPTSTLH